MTSWRCPDEVGDCHTSQAAWWLRFQDEHRAHKGKPHDQCRAKTHALRRLQGSLRLAIGGRGDEYLDNSRYRGSAAAGGGAIIAVPWSEFQRPRELPLSRVRSGRRPGDYRGSVERISASARAAAIAGPQRPAAGRLSRVRGANFSVRESSPLIAGPSGPRLNVHAAKAGHVRRDERTNGRNITAPSPWPPPEAPPCCGAGRFSA